MWLRMVHGIQGFILTFVFLGSAASVLVERASGRGGHGKYGDNAPQEFGTRCSGALIM